MPAFFGYCRASTAGQAYTLDAQKKAITLAYESKYKDLGYEFGGFFEDSATSGGTPFSERPAGRKLTLAAKSGDIICVSKMDRAFRNVVDAANLLQAFEQNKIGILSLDVALDTATPVGRFVMHLLASLGELERSWIRQRTKEALAIRQAKGLPHAGRPPAGWKRTPTGLWIHDERERKLIEWAIKQHDVYHRSWKDIARYLARNGVRRANGDRYHQPWFHYALKARAVGYPGRDGWRKRCTANAEGRHAVTANTIA